MGYGILRLEKIKMSAGGELYGRARHNCREYETGKEPENIDPEKTKDNHVFGAQTIAEVQKKTKDLWGKITGSPRSDAVGLLEAVITLSGGSLSPEKTTAFLKASRSFLEGLYGAEKVIGVYIHADEKTPHLHAFIVPLEEKEVKKKQTAEEKKAGIWRKEKRTVLDAQKIMGNREILRKLQDRFFEQVSRSFGLERGEPVEETKARHRRPSIREEEKDLIQKKINMKYALEAITKQNTDLETEKYHLKKAKEEIEKQSAQEKREIDGIKKDLEAKKVRYEVLRGEFDRLMTIPLERLKLSQPVPGESSQEWLYKNTKELIALHQRAQKAETPGQTGNSPKEEKRPQRLTRGSQNGYSR